MRKNGTTMRKIIEENIREILSNQIALSNIEKKVDTKIIAKGK